MFKKFIFLAFSLAFIFATCGVVQADLAGWEAVISDANPLNWYKFDETSTDCIDSGSGGLNGTYDGVSLGQDGLFEPGTAVGFERTGANRANFTGATNLPGPWTVEYIVKTTKPPAGSDSQALHDGDTTSIRLAGWTAIGEAGFTLYGVADYRFTPAAGLTLNDLIVQQDVWMHITFRNNGSGTQLFFNGELVGTSPDMIDLPRLRIGGRGAGPADHLMGVLDEAVVFDRALTDDEILAHATPTFPVKATNPTPQDGVINSATWANLMWTAGSTAASHDVYVGEDFDQVNEGTGDTFRGNQDLQFNNAIIGFVGFPYPDGLVPGTTYYWRIDEVEADGTTKHKGDVWSFLVPPKTAYNPSPFDGARYISPDNVTLNWTAGYLAALHTVYIGENFDDVNNAIGKPPLTTATYNPGPLEKDKTYYWRVDEFDGSVTHKGAVWSFTTRPEILITDPNLVGWWKLDEGMGNVVLDWSGHDNHGTLANGPVWVEGYDLGALNFDGRDDYVNLGTPAELYIPDNYTYTAWFRVGRDINGNSGPQYLLCIGSRSDLVFGVEDAVGVNGDLSLHYYDTVPSFHAVGVGKTVWSAGDWHMVAGTKDSTGHKIYLDGELRNSDTNTNNDNYATTRMVSLGARAWTGHQFYNGDIDEVRIYNRALTQEEIQDVMRGDLSIAWNPSPSNGATTNIDNALPLSWSPGDNVSQHDVYFGTDGDAVAAAIAVVRAARVTLPPKA